MSQQLKRDQKNKRRRKLYLSKVFVKTKFDVREQNRKIKERKELNNERRRVNKEQQKEAEKIKRLRNEE